MNKLVMNIVFRVWLFSFVGCLFFSIESCKRPESRIVDTAIEEMALVDVEESDPEPKDPIVKTTEEGAEPEEVAIDSKVAEIPSFPFERNLMDSSGRKINAKILGKMDGKIAFLRLSDEQRFVLPLGRLSQGDREFFKSVPEGKHMRAVGDPEENIQVKRNKRLEAQWMESLEEAKKQAEQEKLPIYIFFTGSSWCPRSQAIEAKIISSSKFKSFADKNLVLLKFDVPSSGAPPNELARQHNIRSVPMVMLMTSEGEVLGGVSGYSKERPGQYIKIVEKIIAKGLKRISANQ